jgi:hypothetical protein
VWPWWGIDPPIAPLPPVPITPSAVGRPPLLSLAEVKGWLRIELDFVDEDDVLNQLQMAAHLMTERYIRQTLDPTADGGVGENIKMAALVLLAHWYRNRETVMDGRFAQAPISYYALLATERDYPTY